MRSSVRRPFYLVILLFGAPGSARPATITVNDASDALHTAGCAATGTGTCTLRDAITFSNQNAGKDTITAMSGLGAISPASPLPPLVDAVELKGYPDVSMPQKGFHLVGTNAGSGARGLVVQASDSVVDGLLIEGFVGSGILATGHRNRIGLASGLYVPFRGVGNEVNGNGLHGIEVLGGSENYIYNNRIAANGGAGIYLADGAARNTIGEQYRSDGLGSPQHYYNVLLSNPRAGIQIGRNAADTQTTGNAARFNFFQGNGGTLIDLAGDGATANDPGDVDTGPNGLQNSPSISLAWDGTQYRLEGVLQTTANTAFEANAHSSVFWSNRITAIGVSGGTTDSAGNGSFSIGLAPSEECAIVAVTVATSSGSSELSAGVVVPSPPSPPPVAPTFHTMTPCRLVDTRGTEGPALSSGAPRSFDLNSSCGVPATAKVLSVNVTATAPTGAGFLSFGVGKCPAPTTSTINFGAGQTRANSALLNLDAGGNATVTPLVTGSGTVHLILDVNGYFE